MVEVISLVVSALALGVALAAYFPTRRSAAAAERSAGAAERAEVAAVAAADRAVRVQQEQATREAYRATLVEFRNAAEEFRSAASGIAMMLRFQVEDDLVRPAQRDLDRLADALFSTHSRFGPELTGDIAGTMQAVLRATKEVMLSTIPTERGDGWEQRRRSRLNQAYEGLLGAVAEFREAHRAYLTADLTENP
ncbi:hypothetical protein [Streptomyces filamentosus]|uniref:hypothetical protein n=1 Tax=Streptomyces filamentosus TaxID=67294 RepID=UPI0037D93147